MDRFPTVAALVLTGMLAYLSLLADGGIYGWEPVPTGASATPPDTSQTSPASRRAAPLPPAIVALIKKDYTSPDLPPTRYLSAGADLNGDGRPELLIHLVGPTPCGTGGCPTLVFTPTKGGYTLVSTITVTRPPSASRRAALAGGAA